MNCMLCIVAGEDLMREMNNEVQARTSLGDQLTAVQEDHARRGIRGAEVVQSAGGNWSVRADSGLQGWHLLAGIMSGQVDGSLQQAEAWARGWVSRDPLHRYAWRRRTSAEMPELVMVDVDDPN